MHFCQEAISIIGPTASGKTSLALRLAAEKLVDYQAGVKLISADSRQVYREFPILSGADLDEFQNLDPRISVHGLNVIDLTQDWSLGNFLQFTRPLLEEAATKKQLVIIVGGTILYHQRLFTNNELTAVPPNDNIRAAAESLSVEALQNWLKTVAPQAAAALNNSDFHNPRRLVRQIEIALWQKIHSSKEIAQNSDAQVNHRYVTPKYELAPLPAKIRARVEARWENGAINEVEKVLANQPNLAQDNEEVAAIISKLPIGFGEIRDFLLGKKSPAETLDLWSVHEWQYAKRQLKWPILTKCEVV